jgi:class 3 adenylate cyclase
MKLIENRDPEEAQKIIDPVLHLMMDAVHRYEGTVNQVLGDGIMALLARRWRTRTTPCAPAMQPWRCRRKCGGIAGNSVSPRTLACRSGSA